MAIFSEKQKNLSLYILDDDPFFLSLMCDSIQIQLPWLNVSAYSNKEDFNKGYENHKPDLVLLDYNLGVENSLPVNAHSVLVDLTKNDPNQKVILISDEKTASVLDEYQKFRSVNYLVKSESDTNEIINVIYNTL